MRNCNLSWKPVLVVFLNVIMNVKVTTHLLDIELHINILQINLLNFNRDFLDRTAEEINEKLQENGQIAIGDVAKTFNLPTEFLLSVSFYLF